MALKSIKTIVLEEMDKYIHNIINESLFENDLIETSKNKKKKNKKKSKTSNKKNNLTAKQIKVKKRIEHANARDGQKVGTNVSKEVRDFLNDPTVNVSDVMVQATGLSPTSASSLGAKIAKGDRPVKARLAQTVHRIQNQLG